MTSSSYYRRSTLELLAKDLSVRSVLSVYVEHVSLLRAVQLRSLVTGFGFHFKARCLASQGFTEKEGIELFALSAEVERLDKFVSHSWASSRMSKVFVLLVTGNMTGAIVVQFAVGMFMAILQSQGLLPTVEIEHGKNFKFNYSPWIFATSTLTFFVAFRYWHLVTESLGFKDNYFFDKLCVHQTDKDRKLAGILSFAAYVSNCKEFIVLWDINYFKRLWCILEIAALVKAHEHEALPLIFLPLPLAKTSFAVWVLVFVSLFLYSMSQCLGQGLQGFSVLGIIILIACIAVSNVSRQYLRNRIRLTEQLATFNVADAECFLEQDRQLVNSTLIEWFGSLEAFDEHVHTTIRNKVLATIGRELHWPAKYTWPMFLFLFYQQLDYVVLGFWRLIAETSEHPFSDILGTISWMPMILTLLPAVLHVAKLGQVFFEEKWKNVVVICFMALAILCYCVGVWWSLYLVVHRLPWYVGAVCWALSITWPIWPQRDTCRSGFQQRESAGATAMPEADSMHAADALAVKSGDKEEGGSGALSDLGLPETASAQVSEGPEVTYEIPETLAIPGEGQLVIPKRTCLRWQ